MKYEIKDYNSNIKIIIEDKIRVSIEKDGADLFTCAGNVNGAIQMINSEIADYYGADDEVLDTETETAIREDLEIIFSPISRDNGEMGWYLVDSKGLDRWETRLDAKSQEEAIKEAKSIWDSLSDRDKQLRTMFYVAYSCETEDGYDDESETGYYGFI